LTLCKGTIKNNVAVERAMADVRKTGNGLIVFDKAGNQTAWVDEEDFECAKKFRWQWRDGLVRRWSGQWGISLHSLILRRKEGISRIPNAKRMEHIDGNRLNNRRENLRLVPKTNKVSRKKRKCQQPVDKTWKELDERLSAMSSHDLDVWLTYGESHVALARQKRRERAEEESVSRKAEDENERGEADSSLKQLCIDAERILQ